MVNEIDELMSLDPLDLTTDDPRLEAIIQYHRKARMQYEATGKAPKKEKGPAKSLDNVIQSLTGQVEKPKIDRRF